MDRPGVDEVGVIRPVVAGELVPVLGGHDERVLGEVAAQQFSNTLGDSLTAEDVERAGGRVGEVVLHVHDDQGALGGGVNRPRQMIGGNDDAPQHVKIALLA